MESKTLRERLAKLRLKSKKALGLYCKMERSQDSQQNPFSENQLAEWKAVNQQLYDRIGLGLGEQNNKHLARAVYELRDSFCDTWREAQAAVRVGQKDLLNAAGEEEYVKAAVLAQRLVVLRAREQASRAAYEELQSLVSRTGLAAPSGEESTPEELPIAEPQAAPVPDNVIPMRRRRGS